MMRNPTQLMGQASWVPCSTFATGFRFSQKFCPKRYASSRTLGTTLSRPSLSSGNGNDNGNGNNGSNSGSNSNTPTTIPSSFFTPSLCRHASTSAFASSPTSAASSSASPLTPQTLDWNTFFRLRKSRRRYSLVSSILASITTTGCTISTLIAYPWTHDAIVGFINLDSAVALGLTTNVFLAAGWLIGPFFGNFAWRLLHRGSLAEFMAKEKAFFERIKKYRVDPRGASANNLVPDYYGERIASVGGYRRWLKDQRAFNRKRGPDV